MGLWISFAFVAAVFALMGWSVYSTHRESPAETLEESRSPTVGRFDAVDVLLVFMAWFASSLVPESVLETLSEFQNAVLVAIMALGPPAPAVWLRRRFFPSTVIRFHRDNLALRCGSVFYGLLSLMALVFGFVARWLETSSFLAWSFLSDPGVTGRIPDVVEKGIQQDAIERDVMATFPERWHPLLDATTQGRQRGS